jgi:hypothetical protein
MLVLIQISYWIQNSLKLKYNNDIHFPYFVRFFCLYRSTVFGFKNRLKSYNCSLSVFVILASTYRQSLSQHNNYLQSTIRGVWMVYCGNQRKANQPGLAVDRNTFKTNQQGIHCKYTNYLLLFFPEFQLR